MRFIQNVQQNSAINRKRKSEELLLLIQISASIVAELEHLFTKTVFWVQPPAEVGLGSTSFIKMGIRSFSEFSSNWLGR